MVDIDIKNTIEAKCLLDMAEDRIKEKLGVLYLFTGEVGRGKSYGGLRFLELWYDKMFGEEFPIDHVCETLEQAIMLVKRFKRKGEGIMIEEMSVLAGRREALTIINRLFNKFLDTCRIKQALIIGNAPHISFIDKHITQMTQAWVNFLGVDFTKKISVARPLWMQTSPHKAEPYKHRFVSDEGWSIDYCYFKMPSKELIIKSDILKDRSNDELYDELAVRLTTTRLKQMKELGSKVMPKREMEAYELFLNGVGSDEAADIMGLKDSNNYNRCLSRAKNKLKDPKVSIILRKMEKLTINRQNQVVEQSEASTT